MYEPSDYSSIAFSFNERVGDTSTNISKSIDGLDKTYHEVVTEFVYFLNATGYTYIGGLIVVDKNGNEIFETDTI